MDKRIGRRILDGYFEEAEKMLAGEGRHVEDDPAVADAFWGRCVELAEKYRAQGLKYEIPAKP